jgi:hypothetical protein
VREGVDVPGRELPLSLTVYQPALAIRPAAVQLSLSESQARDEVEIKLQVASQSLKDEQLHFVWDGATGAQVQPEAVTISADQTVEVALRLTGMKWRAGEYSGQLQLAAREGVSLSTDTIPVTLAVRPPSFCEEWCMLLGAVGVTALLVSVAAANHIAHRPRPWGTLTPTKVPAGQNVSTISLAAAAGLLRLPQVSIGSGTNARIRLMGGQVRPLHAAVRVAEHMIAERVGKPPKFVQVKKTVNVVQNLDGGVVKVNNVSVPKGQQSVPLTPGARIAIGEYEFAYRE